MGKYDAAITAVHNDLDNIAYHLECEYTAFFQTFKADKGMYNALLEAVKQAYGKDPIICRLYIDSLSAVGLFAAYNVLVNRN